MVTSQFQVNLQELQQWEVEFRTIAERFEERGLEDKAKQYFTIATLMNQKIEELTGQYQDKGFWF